MDIPPMMQLTTEGSEYAYLIETGGRISANPDSQIYQQMPDGTGYNYSPPEAFPPEGQSNLAEAISKIQFRYSLEAPTFRHRAFNLDRIAILKDSRDISPEDINDICRLIIKNLLANPIKTHEGRKGWHNKYDVTIVHNHVDMIITGGLGFMAEHAKVIERKVNDFIRIYPGELAKPRIVFVGSPTSIATPDTMESPNLALCVLVTAMIDVISLKPGFYFQIPPSAQDKDYAYLSPQYVKGVYDRNGNYYHATSLPEPTFGEHDTGIARVIFEFSKQLKLPEEGLGISLIGPKPITAYDGNDACAAARFYRPQEHDFANRIIKKRISQGYQSISERAEVRTFAWLVNVHNIKTGKVKPILIESSAEDIYTTENLKDVIAFIQQSLGENLKILTSANPARDASDKLGINRGEWSPLSAEAKAILQSEKMPVIHIAHPKLPKKKFATTNAGQEGSLVFSPEELYPALEKHAKSKGDGISRVIYSDKVFKSKEPTLGI